MKDGAISQEGEPSNHRDKQGKKYQESKRRIAIKDYPLGLNQESYSLLNDLKERKVDMTFAQTLELVPKLCREWRKVVSISKKGRRKLLL